MPRPDMVAVLGDGAPARGPARKALRDLRWRQRQTGRATYVLSLDAATTLDLGQNVRGEVDGTGTGGTVWPAAHALARYLARRDCAGWTCLDLGCGTGVAGLAAAALGAKVVALTDLPCALAGARANVLKNARVLGDATIEVCALDWAAPEASRAFDALPSGTACFDVVLAAECVLPKLYPLEPLVACLDAVVGPSTEALVAVELRTWHEFDPKQRFWDLCSERGLRVDAIPHSDFDPAFVADDLEIWRVRRGPARVTGEGIVCARWDAAAVHLEITVASGTYSLETAEKSTVCGRTWPAALAACRAISQGLWPMKHEARVLELGAGCGVVATYLARRGCAVTATDRATSLPGLAATLLANGVRDQVEVRALDWAAAPASLAPPPHIAAPLLPPPTAAFLLPPHIAAPLLPPPTAAFLLPPTACAAAPTAAAPTAAASASAPALGPPRYQCAPRLGGPRTTTRLCTGRRMNLDPPVTPLYGPY